ncbi:MAG: SsrA-binding protein SmpB [bacterium]
MSATLIQNKKAFFNYEITEKFTAGVELFGYEVKTLRSKQGSLDGAYIIVRGGEAYLVGSNIPAYQPKNAPKEYDSKRNRRLLLSKKEISYLSNAGDAQGLTIVPIELYNSGKFIKLSFGIGKGKKKFDKREDIKKRESNRDIERTLKY